MAWLAADVVPERVACVVAVEPSGPPFGNPKTRTEKKPFDLISLPHPLVKHGEDILTRVWDHKSGYSGSVRRYGLADIPLTYDPPVQGPSSFFEELTSTDESSTGLVPPKDNLAEETRRPVFNVAEYTCPTDPRKTAWLQAAAKTDDDPFLDENKLPYPPESQPGRIKKLVHLAKIPHAVVTAHASAHEIYDWATVAFMRQAGCDTSWIKLSEHMILGNGHLMFLETNSSEVADVIYSWVAAKVFAAAPSVLSSPVATPVPLPAMAPPAQMMRPLVPQIGLTGIVPTASLPQMPLSVPNPGPSMVPRVGASSSVPSGPAPHRVMAPVIPAAKVALPAALPPAVRSIALAKPITASPVSMSAATTAATTSPQVAVSGACSASSTAPTSTAPTPVAAVSPVAVPPVPAAVVCPTKPSISAPVTSEPLTSLGNTSTPSSALSPAICTPAALRPIPTSPISKEKNNDMRLMQALEPSTTAKRADEEPDLSSCPPPAKTRTPRSEIAKLQKTAIPAVQITPPASTSWTNRSLPAAAAGPSLVSPIISKTPAPSPETRSQRELSEYMRETYGPNRQLHPIPNSMRENANLFETTASPYFPGLAMQEDGYIQTTRGIFGDGSPSEPIYDPTLMAHNFAPQTLPTFAPREEPRFEPCPFTSGRHLEGDAIFSPIVGSSPVPTPSAAPGSVTQVPTTQAEAPTAQASEENQSAGSVPASRNNA